MSLLPILTINAMCAICGKIPSIGQHRPHSLHNTKKVVRPNLGKWQGLQICARCRKAMVKPDRVRKVQPVAVDSSVKSTK